MMTILRLSLLASGLLSTTGCGWAANIVVAEPQAALLQSVPDHAGGSRSVTLLYDRVPLEFAKTTPTGETSSDAIDKSVPLRFRARNVDDDEKSAPESLPQETDKTPLRLVLPFSFENDSDAQWVVNSAMFQLIGVEDLREMSTIPPGAQVIATIPPRTTAKLDVEVKLLAPENPRRNWFDGKRYTLVVAEPRSSSDDGGEESRIYLRRTLRFSRYSPAAQLLRFAVVALGGFAIVAASL